MAEKIIKVKLAPQVEKRNGGFVDPETGKVISRLKYDQDGCIAVPETRFLSARIEAGELLRVVPKRQEEGDAGAEKGKDQGAGTTAKLGAAAPPVKSKGKSK